MLADALATVRYERVAPGVDFIPLGPHGAAPGDGANAFDSHVCFASSFPVKLANETRVYYMGGDGPHYSPPWGDPLHRNSSFGMGVVGPDRFVGVVAAGAGAATGVVTVKTVPLRVSGPRVLLTADAAAGRVSVTVTATAAGEEATVACAPVVGRNVTDVVLAGCDLSALAGRSVSLTIELEGPATAVYVVGFAGAK